MKTNLFKIIFCTLFAAVLFNSCIQKEEDAVQIAQSNILASVNDELITQADFELSETWLPDFVRQTDDKRTLDIHRFYALKNLLLLAQEAQKQHLLSDAETSIIIKEAQAKLWLNSQPLPTLDLSDAVLDQEIKNHPDNYIVPAKYTVNYSLVHSENSRKALAAGFGIVRSAQLGYNYIDPPELKKNPFAVEGMPRIKNEGGHTRDAKFFNYTYTNMQNDKTNDVGRLGPFTAMDELIFSCPKAISVLENAPVGIPLNENISCDKNWIAFVIPEWKAPKMQLDPDMARLHARQNLIDQARENHKQELIKQQAALYNAKANN